MDTRNVYEFHWSVYGDSRNRGSANEGVRRILATHFDDAFVMFRSWLKKSFPNKDARFKDGLNFEIDKVVRVLTNVETV